MRQKWLCVKNKLCGKPLRLEGLLVTYCSVAYPSLTHHPPKGPSSPFLLHMDFLLHMEKNPESLLWSTNPFTLCPRTHSSTILTVLQPHQPLEDAKCLKIIPTTWHFPLAIHSAWNTFCCRSYSLLTGTSPEMPQGNLWSPEKTPFVTPSHHVLFSSWLLSLAAIFLFIYLFPILPVLFATEFPVPSREPGHSQGMMCVCWANGQMTSEAVLCFLTSAHGGDWASENQCRCCLLLSDTPSPNSALQQQQLFPLLMSLRGARVPLSCSHLESLMRV